MDTADKWRNVKMGDRDRQGLDAVQCRQESNADIQPGRAGRGKLIWRRRSFRAVLVCLLILVLALAYAVVTGKPVPETVGHLLGVLVQVLLGGM